MNSEWEKGYYGLGGNSTWAEAGRIDRQNEENARRAAEARNAAFYQRPKPRSTGRQQTSSESGGSAAGGAAGAAGIAIFLLLALVIVTLPLVLAIWVGRRVTPKARKLALVCAGSGFLGGVLYTAVNAPRSLEYFEFWAWLYVSVCGMFVVFCLFEDWRGVFGVQRV